MNKHEVDTRQQRILDDLRMRGELSTRDLLERLARSGMPVSEDSVARDLDRLRELGWVESRGQGRGRRHGLSQAGRLLSPMNGEAFEVYLGAPREPILYDRQVLARLFSVPLFTEYEAKQLSEMRQTFRDFMEIIDEQTRQRWQQKWLIEFAWKSSAIEGNTYDVMETETLLVDHLEAAGKTHAEAQMILNHQTALRFVTDHVELFMTPAQRVIEQTHRLLTEGLGVNAGLRQFAVGISGSAYRPLDNPHRIREELEWLLQQAAGVKDPWSRAVALLIALSYLQAFADGNKRTSRVTANGILQAHGLPQLIFGTVDPTTYRRACLAFYELGHFETFKQITLASWRQTVDQISSS